MPRDIKRDLDFQVAVNRLFEKYNIPRGGEHGGYLSEAELTALNSAVDKEYTPAEFLLLILRAREFQKRPAVTITAAVQPVLAQVATMPFTMRFFGPNKEQATAHTAFDQPRQPRVVLMSEVCDDCGEDLCPCPVCQEKHAADCEMWQTVNKLSALGFDVEADALADLINESRASAVEYHNGVRRLVP